jgi:hypothetical protein
MGGRKEIKGREEEKEMKSGKKLNERERGRK